MICGQTVLLFTVEHKARLIRRSTVQPPTPEIFINLCKLWVWGGVLVPDRLASA